MASEVKWIKLTTDMFDNRKVKHLRRMPDGNSIVLIWVMLLTMAGKCNAGGMIFLTENIPYTPKMLADELDFEENTVRLALEALSRFGMISMNEEHLLITGWEEHQNIEGMEKIREQNRIRQQKRREARKALAAGNDATGDVTDVSPVTSRDSHATVTQQNKIKEEEGDVDKETYKTIVEYLNDKTGSSYKPTTKKTRDLIKARLNEKFTVDDFKMAIDNKVAEWSGTDMEKFLRPETLFGNKMEGYVNQKVETRSSSYQQPAQQKPARKEPEYRQPEGFGDISEFMRMQEEKLGTKKREPDCTGLTPEERSLRAHGYKINENWMEGY